MRSDALPQQNRPRRAGAAGSDSTADSIKVRAGPSPVELYARGLTGGGGSSVGSGASRGCRELLVGVWLTLGSHRAVVGGLCALNRGKNSSPQFVFVSAWNRA
jgi:hypothetical protein